MEDQLIVKEKRCADIRFQDGALPHAVGVKSFQAMRANRAHPRWSDGFGWTYNHAPSLAYYHGRMYMEYLSNPVDEHEVPGQTLLIHSTNGMDWSFPQVVFPTIEVPTSQYIGPKSPMLTNPIRTVAHQRMAFFRAANDVLLITAFYGIVHDRHKSAPCDGFGVGRAVRRIFNDGSLGEIHFLIYNTPAGYTAENTTVFSPFAVSADGDFVAACKQLLEDGAVIRQMYEEQRFDRHMFPTPGDEALSFYTISDNEMMGVYKRGRTSVSRDNGKTWSEITPNPTVRTATGKVWGQRTADGRFALFYNPTPDGQHRWPIAVVTGEDGHVFDHMLSVTGYMSPQRYGGLDKNLGPQYLRGICERNPQTPDGHVWLAYSNNKEDMWTSCIPVPVCGKETEAVHEAFTAQDELPPKWNIYSPVWAPVRMKDNALYLNDTEPCDRAMAERMIRPQASGRVDLTFCIENVSASGSICIELQDDQGSVPVRIAFRVDGMLYTRADGRTEPRIAYSIGKEYRMGIAYDCFTCKYTVTLADWTECYGYSASVNEITRVVIATKEPWQIPYATVDSIGKYGSKEQVLAGSEEPIEPTSLYILRFDAE